MSANTRVYIATGCALLSTIFSIVGVATPAWISSSANELGDTLTTQEGLFQSNAKLNGVEISSSSNDLIACEVTLSITDPSTGTTIELVAEAGFCQEFQAVVAFTIIGALLSFAAFGASLVTARAGNRSAKTAGVVTLVMASVCFLIGTAIFGSVAEDTLNADTSYGYSFALVLVALFLDAVGAVFLYMYSSNKV